MNIYGYLWIFMDIFGYLWIITHICLVGLHPINEISLGPIEIMKVDLQLPLLVNIQNNLEHP